MLQNKSVMTRVNMDFPSERLSGNNWKILQKGVYRDLFEKTILKSATTLSSFFFLFFSFQLVAETST